MVQRIKANPSFGRQPASAWFITYGHIKLTNERAQMEPWQNGSFVQTQEDSGILLVHWAYCLTGRKYARVVREKWSFCSKPVSPVALKWFVKLYFSLCSLIPGVNPGVTALLSFLQSLSKDFEQVENVCYLRITCIVMESGAQSLNPPQKIFMEV